MSGGDSRGGGQPTTTTTTTTQELSPEQRQLIELVIPKAQSFINQNLEFFPGSAIAGFDPLQLLGQQLAVGAAAGPVQQTSNAANQATQFLLGPVLYPETNPALRAATDAAIRPITEQFTQSVLPNIRSGAITAGQFGGSRQGIAEGLASQAFLRQVGDTSAGIHNRAYLGGLDAMGRALAAAPQTASLAFMPAQGFEAVGQQLQRLEQARLTEEAQRFIQEQIIPFMQAQEVASLAFGIPGGTVTSHSRGVPPGLQGPSGLQVGLSAAGTAAAFAPLALALLSSDRRVKENLEPYGPPIQGVQFYYFNYIGSPDVYFGVIAQELLDTRFAGAVERAPDGLLMVDYGKLAVMMRQEASHVTT